MTFYVQVADFLHDAACLHQCSFQLSRPLLHPTEAAPLLDFLLRAPESVAVAVLKHQSLKLPELLRDLPDGLRAVACRAMYRAGPAGPELHIGETAASRNSLAAILNVAPALHDCVSLVLHDATLSLNELWADPAQPFVQQMNSMAGLQAVRIIINDMRDGQQGEEMVGKMSRIRQLRSLSLAWGSACGVDVGVAGALSQLRSLRELTVTSGRAKQSSSAALYKALVSLTELTSLTLNMPVSPIALGSAQAGSLPHVRSLVVRWRGICDVSAARLARLLVTLPQLCSLQLVGRLMARADLHALAGGLAGMLELRHLVCGIDLAVDLTPHDTADQLRHLWRCAPRVQSVQLQWLCRGGAPEVTDEIADAIMQVPGHRLTIDPAPEHLVRQRPPHPKLLNVDELKKLAEVQSSISVRELVVNGDERCRQFAISMACQGEGQVHVTMLR